jgi:hypothetical protein
VIEGLVAGEFLGRRIEANRPESKIVDRGGSISLCNLTCDFFQSLLPFLFRRLLFFFSSFLVTENP